MGYDDVYLNWTGSDNWTEFECWKMGVQCFKLLKNGLLRCVQKYSESKLVDICVDIIGFLGMWSFLWVSFSIPLSVGAFMKGRDIANDSFGEFVGDSVWFWFLLVLVIGSVWFVVWCGGCISILVIRSSFIELSKIVWMFRNSIQEVKVEMSNLQSMRTGRHMYERVLVRQSGDLRYYKTRLIDDGNKKPNQKKLL